jgi:hypothetical protein
MHRKIPIVALLFMACAAVASGRVASVGSALDEKGEKATGDGSLALLSSVAPLVALSVAPFAAASGPLEPSTWYLDRDGDGFGDPEHTTGALEAPAGYVDEGTDCDDRRAEVHPGATEFCNGYDDDCDGFLDEASAMDATTWYKDADGDGYGDLSATVEACAAP